MLLDRRDPDYEEPQYDEEEIMGEKIDNLRKLQQERKSETPEERDTRTTSEVF